MADRLFYSLDTDSRGIIHDLEGTYQWWNEDDSALDAGDQTWSDYYLTPSDAVATHTRRYITVPSGLPAGLYALQIFSGATPLITAVADQVIVFSWNGSALAQGANTVTADRVSPLRTFFANRDGNEAQNQITLNTWSTGTVTLAAEFAGILNPDAPTLSSLDAVTVTNNSDASATTTSGLALQSTKTGCNVDVAAISSASTHTVRFEVTTIDGNSLTLEGQLKIE